MLPLLAQLIFHAPKHDWEQVNAKYWQIVSIGEETKDLSLGQCPPGMIFIDDNMLDDSKTPDSISCLQNTVCDKWDYLGTKDKKCISYNEISWKNIIKQFPTKHLKYCIDQYEYPNKVGSHPAVLIDWNDADLICKSENKRLCTEDEFTFACEGVDAKPYPYGYKLNNSSCNTNNNYISYRSSELLTKKPYLELDNLWQGKTIGSNTECVSDFGVYDLIGNMEEWTTKSRNSQYDSVLKSGYWVSPGAKCRNSIRSHGPYHKFYQLGFRCCKDYK